MNTWQIDPAHTDVQFSAKHLMVTSVHGKFGAVAGTLTLDEADPTRSGGTVTIQATSLSTGMEARDQHLRSADFFNVEQYPIITFVATKIEPKGGAEYMLTGDLTIRDVTRPITFAAELLGFYASMQGGRRVGVHATAKLDREAWGLSWNVGLETGGWLVGKEVKLEIDVAADLVTETAKIAA